MANSVESDADGQEALPSHADLRRLLAYWEERRGAREFPRRADIDPVDLHFMLDRIALTEVYPPESADDAWRYRLRLVGSYWYRLLGFESTGIWLHDWPHANQRKLTEDSYKVLIEGRRPRWARRDGIVDDRPLRYEILQLPLSDDGDRISMILTGIGPD